ncbi:uncharacterized protein LOC100304290 [Zea mays]|uniref:Uncharacterized protein n=1 Tax=Zea mays TaxID=4577 RepID=C0HEE4_MAIZE|nr:uncharacterized protein LOC100304290 [Zea mays]ACN25397.1 unknown [Zea mays]|eukprot:NP_001159204.1 uncharacterized protein LOC100304290 [Zea mays]
MLAELLSNGCSRVSPSPVSLPVSISARELLYRAQQPPFCATRPRPTHTQSVAGTPSALMSFFFVNIHQPAPILATNHTRPDPRLPGTSRPSLCPTPRSTWPHARLLVVQSIQASTSTYAPLLLTWTEAAKLSNSIAPLRSGRALLGFSGARAVHRPSPLTGILHSSPYHADALPYLAVRRGRQWPSSMPHLLRSHVARSNCASLPLFCPWKSAPPGRTSPAMSCTPSRSVVAAHTSFVGHHGHALQLRFFPSVGRHSQHSASGLRAPKPTSFISLKLRPFVLDVKPEPNVIAVSQLSSQNLVMIC